MSARSSVDAPSAEWTASTGPDNAESGRVHRPVLKSPPATVARARRRPARRSRSARCSPGWTRRRSAPRSGPAATASGRARRCPRRRPRGSPGRRPSRATSSGSASASADRDADQDAATEPQPEVRGDDLVRRPRDVRHASGAGSPADRAIEPGQLVLADRDDRHAPGLEVLERRRRRRGSPSGRRRRRPSGSGRAPRGPTRCRGSARPANPASAERAAVDAADPARREDADAGGVRRDHRRRDGGRRPAGQRRARRRGSAARPSGPTRRAPSRAPRARRRRARPARRPSCTATVAGTAPDVADRRLGGPGHLEVLRVRAARG